MNSERLNLLRVFQQGFSASDLAQPLISFDDFAPSERVKELMEANRCEVAGVRTAGVVTRFVEAGHLGSGPCGESASPFEDSQIVPDGLPLAQLILRLNAVPRLFVQSLGQIGGLITREDLLQPPARMWLFGMVTLIEMRFSRMIEQHCPDDSWQASLSEGRIEKARVLLEERSRRNQQLTLAHCLQFSDKTQIIARNEHLRKMTRFESRRQVEELGKKLERLRNNLAHSQDIVASDWDTIVLLSENLDSVLSGPPGLANSGET